MSIIQVKLKQDEIGAILNSVTIVSSRAAYIRSKENETEGRVSERMHAQFYIIIDLKP